MRNFMEFVNEGLTPEEIEQRKKEALESHMRLYLSKDLSEVLKRMDDESGIANDLLTLSRRNVQFDISFVDKAKDDPSKVSFISTNRVKRMEKEGLNVSSARNNYTSEIWASRLRQELSIGKFVKKIFGNKYIAKQVEQFVNEFKSKSEMKDEKMKVVTGEDIRYWYHGNRYAETKGSLGGSCMRQAEKQKFLDIYIENDGSDYKGSVVDPEYMGRVGLLILLDDNNKLLGRAIVWKNVMTKKKSPTGKSEGVFRTFMDRVYVTHDHLVNTFINYAKERGWLYKQQQTYSNPTYIDPTDGASHTLTLAIRLKPKKYNYYPYMDTMNVYTPETGRLATSNGKFTGKKRISLKDPNGGYGNIDNR